VSDLSSIAAELETARARFLTSPTPEGVEEVVRLETEQRKAQLWAEAAELAVAKARAEADETARAVAKATRSEMLEKRVEIRRSLLARLAAVAATVERLHEDVAGIEADCNADAGIVQRLNQATAEARISAPRAHPIDVSEMRIAVGIHLWRSGWLEPEIPNDANWKEWEQALGFFQEPGSNDDIRDRLRSAQLAFDHAVGDAELARWICIQPSLRIGSLEARQRWANAQQLLDALEDSTHE
jgi:hypothetical protein